MKSVSLFSERRGAKSPFGEDREAGHTDAEFAFLRSVQPLLILIAVLVLLLAPTTHAQFNNTPLVSTSTGGIISGTFGYFNKISATSFSGDGAGLTGISTQGDRIVSGSTNALAISATGYISLTTGATTWGYLSSAANYLPNLTATTLSSTNISGSLIQVGTGNSATCDSSRKGALRYSSTSSTVEYCNSSTWTSLGPSDTTPVSFAVDKNGTDQTVTAATWTKLTWSRENFDTNNNFASDRFTPTVPGKYLITVAAYCYNSSITCYAGIYKNGGIYAGAGPGGAISNPIATVTSIVSMNGTTDYVEAWAYNGGTTIYGGNPLTLTSRAPSSVRKARPAAPPPPAATAPTCNTTAPAPSPAQITSHGTTPWACSPSPGKSASAPLLPAAPSTSTAAPPAPKHPMQTTMTSSLKMAAARPQA